MFQKHVSHITMTIAVAAIVLSGCSAMDPLPSGPSYNLPPSAINSKGCSMSTEMYCRQVADKAAKQTQAGNVGREVAGAVLGAVVGGIVGRAASSPGRTLVGRPRIVGLNPYTGRYLVARPVVRQYGTNLTGLGAAGGIGVGASIAAANKKDTQNTYDSAYVNCKMQHGCIK